LNQSVSSKSVCWFKIKWKFPLRVFCILWGFTLRSLQLMRINTRQRRSFIHITYLFSGNSWPEIVWLAADWLAVSQAGVHSKRLSSQRGITCMRQVQHKHIMLGVCLWPNLRLASFMNMNSRLEETAWILACSKVSGCQTKINPLASKRVVPDC
jgi:hypothetical protein